MAQNSQRIQWTETEVDEKLKAIMSDCFDLCYSTAKTYTAPGEIPSLVAGGNIAGFLKVANAANQIGDWW